MFKYTSVAAIACLLLACNQPDKTQSTITTTATATITHADTTIKPVAPAQLIIAGKSIGGTYINESTDSVITKLGKPDSGDAAMGASLMTWFSKRDKSTYRTSVYAHRNMGGTDENISYVKAIRVTSPYFKTADYAGAGSEMKDVMKLYKLKKHAAPGNKKMWLYDDSRAGIGFEADSTGRCTAVMIHPKGDSYTTYLNMQ